MFRQQKEPHRALTFHLPLVRKLRPPSLQIPIAAADDEGGHTYVPPIDLVQTGQASTERV